MLFVQSVIKVEMMASCYSVISVIPLHTHIVLVWGGKFLKVIGIVMDVDQLLWDLQAPKFKKVWLIQGYRSRAILLDHPLLYMYEKV